MKKNVNKTLVDPFVSIIIPLHWGLKKENYERFIHDLKKYLELDYKKYEIILVTDVKAKLPKLSKRIRHIVTPGKTSSPAEKRDYALKFVKGQVCAFIDDDAYPDKNWLKRAVVHFKKENIISVGGPGVTPHEDTYWQKIGGYILESYLGSGIIRYRFYSEKRKVISVDDYPAYNLFVRTDVLKKVGGYGNVFYGGEDTYLCMKLKKEGTIVYDSKAIVFHHRREFPKGHLKQIGSVGIHRGYFFKEFPETSRRVLYVLPTLLTFCFILCIIISAILPPFFLIIFMSLVLITIFSGMLSLRGHHVKLVPSFLASIGIILTHLYYGIFFVKGLFLEKLEH
jgi:cellulose synthase/poly-beta-1,6-N-acetylglucosamine synthase-like glycosyltransferase